MTTHSEETFVGRLERTEIAAWGEFYRAASPASATACGLGLLQAAATG